MDGKHDRIEVLGVKGDGHIRVFEKDEQGCGKDIRVRTLGTSAGDAGFVAEPAVS